jgi:hypothetical protein
MSYHFFLTGGAKMMKKILNWKGLNHGAIVTVGLTAWCVFILPI